MNCHFKRESEMTKNKIGNLQNKAFLGSAEDNEFWTIERLVDKLFLRMAKVTEKVNNNGKEIHVKKYSRQARELLRWIPIAKPSPAFVIYVSDLTPQLVAQLEDLITAPDNLRYVLTQAVARIFENLDFDRFHMSVARNLRLRLEE
jgi:hypothetical protein